MRITAVEGDITRQDVDVVVNAANSGMRGGGGVDGAIHRAGGPAILADCVERFPHGLPTGSAGATTAGDLPARWVVHVVGPNYRAGQRDPDLLASCYREAVRIADELGARTIAFPAVSAGIYGWPLEDAARIAVGTVADAGAGTSLEEARFVLFGEGTYRVFAELVARLPG
jgi:O-acetyl-ADP-ribose deacetylase (regulator of RNase III)